MLMATRSKLGIVAVGLGVALLAACAPSTDESAGGGDGDGTTLQVWSWRTEDVDEYEKIFDAYEAEHEGVTIEFKPYVATEYDTILSTGLSAKGGPDVAQLRANGGLQPVCSAGRLVELEAEDVDTSAIPDEVLGGARCESDGGLYGVPFASQALVVYYNKAIFEENGLEEPETWDELMSNSKALQDADITPYAVTGKDNWVLPMLHDLFTAPRYGGPEFEAAVQSGEKDFTDPDYVASIETMEQVTPYFPEDVVGVDYATAQTLFTSERAAMYPGGSFELAFFQQQNPDLELGVFAVPPPPGSRDGRVADARLGRRVVRGQRRLTEQGGGTGAGALDGDPGLRPDGERRAQAAQPGRGSHVQRPAAAGDLRAAQRVPHALPAAAGLPVRRADRHRPDGGRPAEDAAR